MYYLGKPQKSYFLSGQVGGNLEGGGGNALVAGPLKKIPFLQLPSSFVYELPSDISTIVQTFISLYFV